MAATGDPHCLGQCWCGQYHLTTTSWTVTPSVTTTNPAIVASHWLKSWHEVEPPTSYEGKHRL